MVFTERNLSLLSGVKPFLNKCSFVTAKAEELLNISHTHVCISYIFNDDVINGNIFRVTGHLCDEFTGHQWIPRKGQWRGALMFSLTCAWINGWVNNREAGDLRRHRAYYDVIIMSVISFTVLRKILSKCICSIYLVWLFHHWSNAEFAWRYSKTLWHQTILQIIKTYLIFKFPSWMCAIKHSIEWVRNELNKYRAVRWLLIQLIEAEWRIYASVI